MASRPTFGTCLLIGAGPGLGLQLARRFAQAGYTAVLFGRNETALQGFVNQLESEGLTARCWAVDAGDFAALRAGIEQVRRELPPVDVLLYNAAGYGAGDALTQDPEGLVQDFRTSAGGFLVAAQALAPDMMARGRGSLLVTGGGAAYQPGFDYLSLGVGKSAVLYMVQGLAPRLAESGVHVGTVTIYGGIKAGTHFSPENIAEAFWRLHQEPPGQFTTELAYR